MESTEPASIVGSANKRRFSVSGSRNSSGKERRTSEGISGPTQGQLEMEARAENRTQMDMTECTPLQNDALVVWLNAAAFPDKKPPLGIESMASGYAVYFAAKMLLGDESNQGSPRPQADGGDTLHWPKVCLLFQDHMKSCGPSSQIRGARRLLTKLDATARANTGRDSREAVVVALELLLTLVVQQPSLHERELAIGTITALPIEVQSELMEIIEGNFAQDDELHNICKVEGSFMHADEAASPLYLQRAKESRLDILGSLRKSIRKSRKSSSRKRMVKRRSFSKPSIELQASPFSAASASPIPSLMTDSDVGTPLSEQSLNATPDGSTTWEKSSTTGRKTRARSEWRKDQDALASKSSHEAMSTPFTVTSDRSTCVGSSGSSLSSHGLSSDSSISSMSTPAASMSSSKTISRRVCDSVSSSYSTSSSSVTLRHLVDDLRHENAQLTSQLAAERESHLHRQQQRLARETELAEALDKSHQDFEDLKSQFSRAKTSKDREIRQLRDELDINRDHASRVEKLEDVVKKLQLKLETSHHECLELKKHRSDNAFLAKQVADLEVALQNAVERASRAEAGKDAAVEDVAAAQARASQAELALRKCSVELGAVRAENKELTAKVSRDAVSPIVLASRASSRRRERYHENGMTSPRGLFSPGTKMHDKTPGVSLAVDLHSRLTLRNDGPQSRPSSVTPVALQMARLTRENEELRLLCRSPKPKETGVQTATREVSMQETDTFFHERVVFRDRLGMISEDLDSNRERWNAMRKELVDSLVDTKSQAIYNVAQLRYDQTKELATMQQQYEDYKAQSTILHTKTLRQLRDDHREAVEQVVKEYDRKCAELCVQRDEYAANANYTAQRCLALEGELQSLLALQNIEGEALRRREKVKRKKKKKKRRKREKTGEVSEEDD